MTQRIENFLSFFRPMDSETLSKACFPGFIWKDKEDVLHVDLVNLCAGSGTTCICAISDTVEGFEAFSTEVSELFSAKELVIHDRRHPKKFIQTFDIESGSIGTLQSLGSGDWCGNRPNILGVVRWDHSNETDEFLSFK